MSRMDHATVELDLDGEIYELRPTLQAMRTISRHFGGIRAAMERIGGLDFDALSTVIAAGSGIKGRGKDRDRMEEALFGTGVAQATGPVAEYLSGLLDPTGRESDDSEETGEGKA